MFQQWLSLCKALGMSSTTMGETPHSCRDITNLSCFGFFNSLTAGARQKNFSLIQWDRIARLCSAFNYLKGVTRRKMRVRKSCFSHYTADESPWDASVVFENNTELSKNTFILPFFWLSIITWLKTYFVIVSETHQCHHSCVSLKVYSLSKAKRPAELWYSTNEPEDIR